MRLSKTNGLLHTAPLKVTPLSRIRYIRGRKSMVFAYFGLANAIGVLFFATRLSKNHWFFCSAQSPITDSQYPRSRTYCNRWDFAHGALSSRCPIKDSQYQLSKATGCCYFAARKCDRAFIFCNAIFKNR